MIGTNFPALLESFFTERLISQRRASPHTVASYRDTFRLLLQFAKKHAGKQRSHCGWATNPTRPPRSTRMQSSRSKKKRSGKQIPRELNSPGSSRTISCSLS